MGGVDGLGVDPPVDLDVDVLGQRRAQAPDPLDRVRHELLAAVAGMDAHAEHEIGIRRDGGHVLRLALGVEGDAGLEAVLARGGDRGGDVVHDLVVEGGAVAARARDLGEVAQRVVDHQVAVEHAACVVHERRDRLEHDGADRHGLDEVAVADVEVEDACAGVQQHADLLPEPVEVRRVERRLDLDHSDPVALGHRSTLCPQAADEEAACPVHLRSYETSARDGHV